MNRNGSDKTREERVEEMKQKLKDFFMKFRNTGKFFSKNKKSLIVCASVLVICGAVYLNYALFSADEGQPQIMTEVIESDPTEEYFTSAVISRQKARDEAIEVLQQVVDRSDAVEEVKTEAYTGINVIAQQIESESNIEQLVLAKGFEQCLAVVSENSASIIVKSDGLLANEVAQIKEIVYEQAGIHPRDIKIIEKN